jgi:hypothetical protein
VKIREADGTVVATYDDLHYAVRIMVEPPVMQLSADEGGGSVRLVDEEGWLEVRFNRDEMCIEVRGAHAIALEPKTSNAVLVRLVGAKETPTR